MACSCFGSGWQYRGQGRKCAFWLKISREKPASSKHCESEIYGTGFWQLETVQSPASPEFSDLLQKLENPHCACLSPPSTDRELEIPAPGFSSSFQEWA